ncbi:3-oxoacyl-ACP reductase family protein [Streptomyces hiroshimensis]|uniref:3-ketoacyl-ACP reductase n=1 Tax=Streptomyces hiroshimensis TaxID=66424 RepID=A0ABQ2ZD64_9ACTN|nr:3-oxoacyl-ACP reductase family protein [Streptomyces hiroshimensis]GGY11017.1 3-ketoacyl-ACP reductase [Streptomyces hiroshimensis]
MSALSAHPEDSAHPAVQEYKSALITGGSRGIGAAIATRLAADGIRVAITYNSSRTAADRVVEAITAAGGHAVALRADSADAARIRAAADATAEEYGRIDILVNNAGIGTSAPFEEMSLEHFDRTMAVNVRGPFAAAQAVLPHMPDHGRIINIGSVFADRTPFGTLSAYVTSKAAVAGLTRALARDLGGRGITVNNIQPGPISTDLTSSDTHVHDVMTEATALRRFGTPEEIAGLVAYLAGPEAAYITGATITADGGYTA